MTQDDSEMTRYSLRIDHRGRPKSTGAPAMRRDGAPNPNGSSFDGFSMKRGARTIMALPSKWGGRY